MPTTDPLVRRFAEIPLLAALSGRERGRLARRATTRTYPEGAVIVRQGDTSMAVYVVLSGRVGIAGESDAVREPFSELAAGSVFGEMGVLDDAPRSATVVALEPTECALLSRWDLERPLHTEPAFAVALLRTVNERLRRRGGVLEPDLPA
jgi:CRP-like cAMP-binding protein